MSEFFFGLTKTEPSQEVYDRLDAICKDEGGYGFTWLDIPGTRQGWFSGPNMGNPFDNNLRDRVIKRCADEEIWPVPPIEDENE